MKKFDIIVIGAGSGLNVVDYADNIGLKVALVEHGPMGGTCLNRGCIPYKILIHSADVADTIKKSSIFGINSKIVNVDFKRVVNRAFSIIDKDAKNIESGIRQSKNITLFKNTGRFIGKKTLQVGNEVITADRIVIAAGTRPMIPDISGLDKTKYLTSDDALRLKKLPKELTIIGGGYIAAELAHLFGSLGSKVSIIQRSELLLGREDQEIAEKLTNEYKKRFNVLLNSSVVEVYRKNDKIITVVKKGKNTKKIKSDQLLIATGRVSNTDILDVTKTGVRLNKEGFIEVNDYMETNIKGIYALGDIIGKYLFKHSANLEAEYVVLNALMNKKIKIDYDVMPHAIFSNPQIAGVGLIGQELKDKKIKYAIGRYDYINTGMGLALNDKVGLVKIYADKKTKKILGCHIVGSDASILIHEVIVAMKYGGTVDAIEKSVHVHPALSEVIQRAVKSIKW